MTTFFDALKIIQNEYKTSEQVVIFELIYFLSKKVKNTNDFLIYSWEVIDFNIAKLHKLANQYYVKKKSLAHIVKKAKFLSLEFEINKHVLSPRHETEWIVNKFVNKYQDKPSMRIYDLGCGSGVIGITIKKYCPQHTIVCVDKSKKAVNLTIKNADINNVEIATVKSDMLSFISQNNKPDLIISNPPYISKSDAYDKQMLKHEPKKALYASKNGLFYYFKILDLYLRNKCETKIWFEIGFEQKDEIFNYINQTKKATQKFCYKNIQKKECLLIINDIIN